MKFAYAVTSSQGWQRLVNAKRKQTETDLRARFTRGQLTYITESAA